MTMRLYDNPAVRLLDLLTKGREIPQDKNCRSAWALLLNTEDPATLMSRMGKVMELPAEIIQDVREFYPGLLGSCSYWSRMIEKAFAEQNFKTSWSSFIAHIDGHTINYLNMTADLIANRQPIGQISLESAEALRVEILDLIDVLLKASIDEPIRIYVVRALRKIVIAIEEYSLTGASPILDAVDASMGHVVTDSAYKSFLSEGELGARVAEVLSSAANLVTAATGLPQLPAAWDATRKLLGI